LDVMMAEKGAFDEKACCLAHLIARQSASRFAIRLRRDAGFIACIPSPTVHMLTVLYKEGKREGEEEERACARVREAEMKRERERERDRKRGARERPGGRGRQLSRHGRRKRRTSLLQGHGSSRGLRDCSCHETPICLKWSSSLCATVLVVVCKRDHERRVRESKIKRIKLNSERHRAS